MYNEAAATRFETTLRSEIEQPYDATLAEKKHLAAIGIQESNDPKDNSTECSEIPAAVNISNTLSNEITNSDPNSPAKRVDLFFFG